MLTEHHTATENNTYVHLIAVNQDPKVFITANLKSSLNFQYTHKLLGSSSKSCFNFFFQMKLHQYYTHNSKQVQNKYKWKSHWKTESKDEWISECHFSGVLRSYYHNCLTVKSGKPGAPACDKPGNCREANSYTYWLSQPLAQPVPSFSQLENLINNSQFRESS